MGLLEGVKTIRATLGSGEPRASAGFGQGDGRSLRESKIPTIIWKLLVSISLVKLKITTKLAEPKGR